MVIRRIVRVAPGGQLHLQKLGPVFGRPALVKTSGQLRSGAADQTALRPTANGLSVPAADAQARVR